MRPASWIFSTEPHLFPWSSVLSRGVALWDGIRGGLARKHLAQIQPGDLIWGYHSSPEKRIVCRVRAVSSAFPDPVDPRWLALRVGWEGWVGEVINLSQLRQHPLLGGMMFLRIPRLSVAPLNPAETRVLDRLTKGLSAECPALPMTKKGRVTEEILSAELKTGLKAGAAPETESRKGLGAVGVPLFIVKRGRGRVRSSSQPPPHQHDLAKTKLKSRPTPSSPLFDARGKKGPGQT